MFAYSRVSCAAILCQSFHEEEPMDQELYDLRLRHQRRRLVF